MNTTFSSIVGNFSISFSRGLLFFKKLFETVFKYDYRSYKLLLTYMLYLASILIIIIIPAMYWVLMVLILLN